MPKYLKGFKSSCVFGLVPGPTQGLAAWPFRPAVCRRRPPPPSSPGSPASLEPLEPSCGQSSAGFPGSPDGWSCHPA